MPGKVDNTGSYKQKALLSLGLGSSRERDYKPKKEARCKLYQMVKSAKAGRGSQGGGFAVCIDKERLHETKAFEPRLKEGMEGYEGWN